LDDLDSFLSKKSLYPTLRFYRIYFLTYDVV
jgi:hypothetical protein